jgi:hypothetical protein
MDFDYAVLGITDHNIVPISMQRALEYSTKRVIVIPGMQWRIHQKISDRLRKRSLRREILTLGNHDDLRGYITNRTPYRIADDEEIIGHCRERELLAYLADKPGLAMVVPHPKHFFIDYYGPNEIKDLKNKMESQGIEAHFFVEVKTGCDPFPRFFSAYHSQYSVLGASDAHEIKAPFGSESMLSVKTTMPVNSALLEPLNKTVEQRRLASFEQLVKDTLSTLNKHNKRITIKKHYGRSTAQIIAIAPRLVRRRFDSFPRNFLK